MEQAAAPDGSKYYQSSCVISKFEFFSTTSETEVGRVCLLSSTCAVLHTTLESTEGMDTATAVADFMSVNKGSHRGPSKIPTHVNIPASPVHVDGVPILGIAETST